jgi:hypothetical protein
VLPFFSNYLKSPLVIYAGVVADVIDCVGACEGNNDFTLSGLQVNGTPISGSAAPFNFNVNLAIRNQDPHNRSISRSTPNNTSVTILLDQFDDDNQPITFSFGPESWDSFIGAP